MVLFGGQAEIASKNLHEGSPVYVEGRLRKRKRTDREWLLYTNFGDALLAPLANTLIAPECPLARVSNAVAYLRLLQACEMDAPPRFFRAAREAAMAATYTGEDPEGCIPIWEVEQLCGPSNAIPAPALADAADAVAHAFADLPRSTFSPLPILGQTIGVEV